ncbi:phage antirepressor N-terminal domain-containing protein [Anaerotruncus rubiinfantis]|uniref:phage antirepressor N-terminal domain-containing protein n=1 Tax=Anaerotruncus rubiinfantis TaxID=1720200 RepID=UPI003D795D78
MKNELVVKPVNFLGDTLMAAQDAEGNIWVGVSWMCNGIGLNKNEKDRQVKNVQADSVLKEGCRKFDAGVFDPNNITVALRLEFVPLWLAKISITPTMKIENPELAEHLKQYQLKAKDVLAAAFLPTNKPARFSPKASSVGEVASLVKINRVIMKDQGSSANKIARQTDLFYRQFGVDEIPDYVEPNYEQMELTTTCREVTTTMKFPPTLSQ